MDTLKSLDILFEKKIFRIPDYQRGYAWQKSQLEYFWDDLINLSGKRRHYIGVLTLKEIAPEEIKDSDNEYWLVEDHSYRIYHVVDGQQRLTTFVIFLQALIDFIKQLDENKDKSYEEIDIIPDSLNLKKIIDRYLFEIKRPNEQYRTYKFGYEADDPSYDYLRYEIFHESAPPTLEKTFYTLNLENAKKYFYEQIKGLHDEEGLDGLRDIYKKLTKDFLFNEYVIKDDLDVFVAFEAMNNRGKRLSDLELLKNRLIYLTTLYPDTEVNRAERQDLREAINAAWKEVYRQLGRNDKHPLNDDDFLKAHWIMYFQYSRSKGKNYIKFLLDERFSPQKVYEKIGREVSLDAPEEQRADFEMDDTFEMDDAGNVIETKARLQPREIKEYANSLKESAAHWFNSWHPYLSTRLSDKERNALDRLNRIGMGYFRPLVMSILKNDDRTTKEQRVTLLRQIERFIFIVFRLSQANSSKQNTEFYKAAREFNQGELTLEGIKEKLNDAASHYFHDDGTFDHNDFYSYLSKAFNNDKGIGYYDWKALRYFLYEYELHLQPAGKPGKVSWEAPKDKISIEHVFPQTPTKNWKTLFENKGVDEKDFYRYCGSIGNLLLLSMSINSSLQNDDFAVKKQKKRDKDGKVHGYSNGSYSELEVAQYQKWTPKRIEERGLRLLGFMEKRWNLKFKDKRTKKSLLFLNPKDEK